MGPWETRWFRAVLRALGWELVGDILMLLCCRCIRIQVASLSLFLPLEVRPLKAAYSW
jgi:hypothetical protein